MTRAAPRHVCPCCARRPAGQRQQWCGNELLELGRRWRDGEAAEAIAAELGRSVNAIRAAARDNGFARVIRAPRRARCARCGALAGPGGACAPCDGGEEVRA